MFRRYVEEINRDLKDLRSLSVIVNYLGERRRDLEQIDSELSSLISDYTSGAAATEAIEVVYRKANDILKSLAMQAIVETKEFNERTFKDRLRIAIDRSETIRIVWHPSTEKIDVIIDLNKTAGRLVDYARAINRTRKELGVGNRGEKPILDPGMASYMWMEKYYKPAREGTEIPQPREKERTSSRKVRSDKKQSREYDKAQYIRKYKQTIRTRIGNFETLAPFWELVDRGNLSTTISSDYGGTPYPPYGPTNFVSRAKKIISARLSQELKRANISISEWQEERRAVRRAIKYIDDYLEKVYRTDLGEARQDKEGFAIQQVKKQLAARFGKSNVTKIMELVRQLALGEVDPNKRVNVGKRGQPVKIRIKRLSQIVSEYQEGL